jgi:hypothetical protein
VQWLKTVTSLPIVCKGIVTAEDSTYFVAMATNQNEIYFNIKLKASSFSFFFCVPRIIYCMVMDEIPPFLSLLFFFCQECFMKYFIEAATKTNI